MFYNIRWASIKHNHADTHWVVLPYTCLVSDFIKTTTHYMKIQFLRILLPLAFFTLVTSCQKNEVDEPGVTEPEGLVSEFDHSVVWEWNELFLRIDKDAIGFRPNPAPRALAYMGLAAYEVAVPGMPAFQSIRNQFSDLKLPVFPEGQSIHWPTALNSSYAYLMSKFFFKSNFVNGFGHLSNNEAQKLIESLETALEKKYETEINDPIQFNESKAWGDQVASAIWTWASTDSYAHEADNNPYSNDPSKPNYWNWREKSMDASGKVIPGKWQPTNDNPDGGRFPFGGRFRAFVSNEAQKLSPPPLAYSESQNSAFYAQALEVYTLSNAGMPFEDRWVSEFWSDDIEGQTFSPPSRVIAILDEVLVWEKSNLEKAVESVAKLGLGLNDFAVNCWHSKWVYNVERPETYIQRLMDPNWEPMLTNSQDNSRGLTPPFPAYPSGHSTFAGGAAVLLSHLFGSNYEFTDLCHKGRIGFLGTPRNFNSFEDAMRENALSRITLGVHFRMDCDAGLTLGQQTARRVLKLPWKVE